MGSIDLWLAIIFQCEYPIQTLAAAALAAGAAGAADADACKLCCWTIAAIGGDWRSSVQKWSYTREGATQEGNVHSKRNTGRACAQKNTMFNNLS
eukprot:550678-Pelagomonas_calceolata.AAC.1